MPVVTKVYENDAAAHRAAIAVNETGIQSLEMSIVRGRPQPEPSDAVEDVAAVVGGSLGLLAGIGAFAMPGLGTLVAGGWLGAAGMGGAADDAMPDMGIAADDVPAYAEAFQRGAVGLTVRCGEGELARIVDALEQTSPLDVYDLPPSPAPLGAAGAVG